MGLASSNYDNFTDRLVDKLTAPFTTNDNTVLDLSLIYANKQQNGTAAEPKTIKLYQLAADNGDIVAANLLGNMYRKGLGVAVDFNKAFELYTNAATVNNPAALLNLSKMYFKGEFVNKNLKTSIEMLTKSADLGYSPAICILANMYRTGNKYIVKNHTKAIELHTIAIEKGNCQSMCKLARLYLDAGAKQNCQSAIDLYKKAIDNRYYLAYNCLGHMYYSGNGVDLDYTIALEMFRLGAINGNLQSLVNMGTYYSIHENKHELAAKLYTIALTAGYYKAYNYMGNMYYYGLGVKQNYKNAARLYKEGAKLKDPNAMLNLAHILYKGIGVTKDIDSAVKIIQKIVNTGHYKASCTTNPSFSQIDQMCKQLLPTEKIEIFTTYNSRDRFGN